MRKAVWGAFLSGAKEMRKTCFDSCYLALVLLK